MIDNYIHKSKHDKKLIIHIHLNNCVYYILIHYKITLNYK